MVNRVSDGGGEGERDDEQRINAEGEAGGGGDHVGCRYTY